MLLDRAPGHVESHAGTVRFVRDGVRSPVEAFKDLFLLTFGDADTTVLDGDHVLAIDAVITDDDRRARARVFDRITDKVAEDSFHALGITVDENFLWPLYVEFECDVLLRSWEFLGGKDAFKHLSDIGRYFQQVLVAPSLPVRKLQDVFDRLLEAKRTVVHGLKYFPVWLGERRSPE